MSLFRLPVLTVKGSSHLEYCKQESYEIHTGVNVVFLNFFPTESFIKLYGYFFVHSSFKMNVNGLSVFAFSKWQYSITKSTHNNHHQNKVGFSVGFVISSES